MDWAIRMTDSEQLFLDEPRADTVLAKTQTANVAALLPSIKLRHAERISAELVIPARDGAYAELPIDLEPRLAAALRGRGIHRLYSHQLAAWNASRTRQHTVVVTPTASGKTLCYNLPVLQAAMHEHAKALYLFPTKALAQDQHATALLHLRDHGETLVDDAQLELAGLYARSGQWEEAVPIWESLATRGVARAMERLAKYCEHRQRDFGAALHWTEHMLALDYEVGSCEQRRLRLLTRRENARKHGQ